MALCWTAATAPVWTQQRSAAPAAPSARPSRLTCRAASRRQWRRQQASCLAALAAPERGTDEWLARTAAGCVQPAGNGSDALAALRRAGTAALSAARTPTTRDEAYRFTDLSSLTQARLVVPPVGQHQVDVSPFSCGGAVQVVFVDGVATRASVAAAAAALPPGATLAHLSALSPQQAAAVLRPLAAGHPSAAFDALNAVCCSDPLCLLLPPGLSADHVPLHLLHVSASTAGPGLDGLPCAQPRVLVHLGAGAAATLVEEFTCTPAVATAAAAAAAASSKAPAPVCAVNACFHAALEAKAVLTHGRVSLLSGAVPQVGLTTVAQAEGSSYSLTSGCVAGMLSRHDVSITQGGPATSTSQQAFVLAAGSSAAGEVHTRLLLDHPDGVAKQLHKCIAAVPGAKCVFNGGVTLHRAAQRTDAQQLSRALLLAPRATVHAKPTLQINADDVKCSHGCSVADLSGDELFYFMARGIDAAAARDALVYSFAAEVVDQLPAAVAPVTARLKAAIRAELAVAQQQVKDRA